jgi:F-type H+-transporting ATPase subunit a
VRKIFTPRNIAIIVGVLAILIISRILFPVPLPAIEVAAEKIPGVEIFGFPITNTMPAVLLADLTLLVIALLTTRRMEMVPQGLQNLVEWVIEAFYNLTTDVAGPNAKRFFPLIMTIFLFVLVANWWHFAPGFDSIGIIEHPHKEGARAYEIKDLGSLAILTPKPAEGTHEGYILIPFLRAAATDLNVPLALALITMVYVQYTGLRMLGRKYLRKFFNFTGFSFYGLIDAFVGVLELVAEFAKVISFTFRLFGNIFAGQVLLFVIPFLIPWLVVLPFYGLEVFVGFIQAFVFAMLALVFLSMAVLSHEGHAPEAHGKEEGETAFGS